MPIKIGVLIYDNCLVSGAIAFSELFDAANRRVGGSCFECVFVSNNGVDINLNVGAASHLTMCHLDDITTVDIDALLVPGFWTQSISDVSQFQRSNSKLIHSLSRLESQLEIYAYCSSVSLLAASGKLEGKSATSTWWLREYLCQTYQGIDWRFADTMVISHNIVTASGVQGYLPIAKYLIEKHCGSAILAELTDLMVLPKPLEKVLPMQELHIIKSNDPLIVKIFQWVENTQATDLKIDNLSLVMNISKRTLARKVVTLTGLTCATFMRKVKIQQACNLLRLNRLPIKQTCFKLGYNDESSFRRIFKQTTDYTPAQFIRYFVK